LPIKRLVFADFKPRPRPYGFSSQQSQGINRPGRCNRRPNDEDAITIENAATIAGVPLGRSVKTRPASPANDAALRPFAFARDVRITAVAAACVSAGLFFVFSGSCKPGRHSRALTAKVIET
jgi:hypothetical protein